MEKDQVRGNDSLVTFEEILQIAKDKDVSSLLQKRLFFSHVKIDWYSDCVEVDCPDWALYINLLFSLSWSHGGIVIGKFL